jgi:3-dehydroquinate synthase
VEAATDFRKVTHGEAVGLGMLFAARIAELQGKVHDLHEYTRELLALCGLPSHLPPGLGFQRIWKLMGQDKKAGSPGREFVICTRRGDAELTPMPDLDVAARAFDSAFHLVKPSSETA